MVQFSNPRLGPRQRLTVWTAPSPDGYRLIVSYPDGLRRIHYFADHSALYNGTVEIQATLTKDGWEPVRPPFPRWRSCRLRGRRATDAVTA